MWPALAATLSASVVVVTEASDRASRVVARMVVAFSA